MRRLKTVAHWLLDFRNNRRFERWPGAYRGVFRSLAEANASAPQAKTGYNHPEFATLYDDRVKRLFPSDYPVLFWLRQALTDSQSVFDFGGHVGVSFYAYRRYLTFRDELRWKVCEVPETVKAGREVAEREGETRLSFCTDFEECEGSDLLLASGSLHYLEPSLAQMLSRIRRRPRHVVVNKLPLTEGEPFVTLQNTIHACNAYKVQNRGQFVEGILALGYEVVDAWENADMSCRIPLHPERTVRAYSGYYFLAQG